MRRSIDRALMLVGIAVAAVVHAQVGEADVASVSRLIVAQTNTFRQAHGRGHLASDAKLTDAAEHFAAYMARTDRYGHEADGSTPAKRAQARGYDYCAIAENIAFMMSSAGFETAALAKGFVDGWEASPGHRRNMLDGAMIDTGVGVAQSATSKRYYAVQMFGRPRSAMIVFSIVNESARQIVYQLGSDSFQLAPRTIETHRQCHATKVSLGTGADATTFDAVSGRRYAIDRDEAGRYRVRTE